MVQSVESEETTMTDTGSRLTTRKITTVLATGVKYPIHEVRLPEYDRRLTHRFRYLANSHLNSFHLYEKVQRVRANW